LPESRGIAVFELNILGSVVGSDTTAVGNLFIEPLLAVIQEILSTGGLVYDIVIVNGVRPFLDNLVLLFQ
jgi:hypothetical protein